LAQPDTSPKATLIYRCPRLCTGLWWDEYRQRPLRLQAYTLAGPIGGGPRIGYSNLGPFLEALDSSGDPNETLGEWGGGTNVALDLFFVKGGTQLVVVSTDGGYDCATTIVYLHDLEWECDRTEALLEPREVHCLGESRGPEFPDAVHVPNVGVVVPSEDGRLLANSFDAGRSLTARTQLIDLDAHKVVAETDGSLLGRVAARSFYVAEPIYTEQRHRVRDYVLKEFSEEGVNKVGRAKGTTHVVRGSGGRLFFGGGIYKVDTSQPHYDKPEAQVMDEEFKALKAGVKPTPPGYVRPLFPCQILESGPAWQEPAGTIVVAVEERCGEKNGYALYRVPKP